jgi:predicted DNA binding protein
MSIFLELELEADQFALSETFEAFPEALIEIERVIAADDVLTPYFWVSNVDFEKFEAVVQDDPSVANLRRVDQFDDLVMYHAEWTEALRGVTSTVVDIATVILDATGTNGQWDIEMRFDGSDQLTEFQDFAKEADIDFTVKRLFEVSQPFTGTQYGLTPKQQEALVTALEAGYFDMPREATLTEIADELKITQQSLSNRLRRGYRALIASTLTAESPNSESASTDHS